MHGKHTLKPLILLKYYILKDDKERKSDCEATLDKKICTSESTYKHEGSSPV